jgi:hypothetical protein
LNAEKQANPERRPGGREKQQAIGELPQSDAEKQAIAEPWSSSEHPDQKTDQPDRGAARGDQRGAK